ALLGETGEILDQGGAGQSGVALPERAAPGRGPKEEQLRAHSRDVGLNAGERMGAGRRAVAHPGTSGRAERLEEKPAPEGDDRRGERVAGEGHARSPGIELNGAGRRAIGRPERLTLRLGTDAEDQKASGPA